jgi:hypothetical protein
MFERNEETWEWEPFTPKAYYNAIDAHGSPVNVGDDLELASPRARYLADFLLVRLEGIHLVAERDRPGTERPVSASGELLQPAGPGCGLVPASAVQAGAFVSVPPHGLIIRPDSGPPVDVSVARFSESVSAFLIGSVAGGASEEVPIHADASNRPWLLRLLGARATGAQAVRLCSIA